MHIGSCSSDAVDSMASLPSGCTPTLSLPVGRGGMKVKCSGWYEAGWDVLPRRMGMGMRMKAEMEPWKLGTLSLRDAPSYLSGVA